MHRIALKYRPKTFAQVLGQDHPKRTIQQLILNNRSCANLLAHGSIGSGKTTLIRLYAMALNCENPTAQADCCFRCEPCRAAADEANGLRSKHAISASGLEELDAPRFRDLDVLKDRLDLLLETPVPAGGRRVIFIDEIQTLSRYRDSNDYLLKKLEEPPPNISFCFATTALERISPALRSRTFELEVRPLTHELSVELLAKAAAEEGLVVGSETLSLIAGLGAHQPRNMLQALEKSALISDGAEITRDRVASIFGVDYIDVLIDFFEALGSGSFEKQTRIFLGWSDSVRRKVRLIQLFLIGLHYSELCRLNVSIDPVIASIRSDERQRVLAAFRIRLPDADLKALFENMLAVWPVVTDDMSEEALLAIMMRFQAVANSGEILERAPLPCRLIPEPVAEARADEHSMRRARIKSDDASAPRDPAFLSRANVRKIFAAASFLVQKGHEPFNARITIRHRDFGHTNQSDASRHFAKFSQALKGRLEHWGGSGLRIFVQEASEDGSCGRVIAHVPKPVEAALWLKKWHRSSRTAVTAENAITCEMVPAATVLEGHWACVRWLCGGFNPNDPIRAALGIEDEFNRVAGDIGQRTRVDYSEPLGSAARSMEEDQCGGLAIVSAFDDGQFQRLYDGWELDECAHRREQRARWDAGVAEIKARYPLDGSMKSEELLQYEVEEFKRRFSPSPRTWPIWSAR